MTQFAQLADTFLWPHNNGTCLVKSASKFLFQQQHAPWNKPLWNWIWALTCPKTIQIFFWKAMHNRLPTKQFLAFRRPHVDTHYPWCHTPETTIHILCDCPWATEIWRQSPRILPPIFFQMTLQDWLRCNATKNVVILPYQIPWHVYFPFPCWNIWLARNGRIFSDQSRSQHNIIYSSVQATMEFYYLASTARRTQVKLPRNIHWHVSPNPFIKINTNGSALGNPGIAGDGGILRDHLGQWISGFSLHVGLATNNMAELVAVRQGLAMA